MDIEELKNRVKFELVKERNEDESLTIADLCKKFDIVDEFVMQSIIAELERSGDVELAAFEKIYR